MRAVWCLFFLLLPACGGGLNNPDTRPCIGTHTNDCPKGE